LIYRLEQDETIGAVGGVYCCKSEPADPLVYRGNGRGAYWDWKVGEFFEVTGLGLDCNLLRVQMLEELAGKGGELFKTVDEDEFLDGRQNAEAWTEDLYFYRRVSEETKYKIYCDASVICEHHDVYGGKVYRLPADSLPMRQKATFKDKKLLMIGRPVELLDGERDSFAVVRFGYEDFVDYRGQIGNLPFAEREFDWTIATIEHVTPKRTFDEFARVTRGKLSVRVNEYLNSEKVRRFMSEFGQVEDREGWLEVQMGK
jgi:hypothetical protein